MTLYVDKLTDTAVVIRHGEALSDVLSAPETGAQEQTHARSVRRPYKRSDIPTAVVLSCIHTLGFTAFEVLSETFPGKVVHAAFLRELNNRRLECGTSETKPWLTPDGKQWLIHHSDAAARGRKMNGQSELREKPCTLTNSTRPRDAQ